MLELLCKIYLWPVGEVVNTSPSQGDIHGFKSHTGYHLVINKLEINFSSFFIK